MAVRYFFEHYSTNNDLYRCEIYSDDYSGSTIEIEGSITNGFNQHEGVTYAIKSKYARIQLIATSNENLGDLLQEEDRYWSVKLYLNSNPYFFGYLTGENSYQDFVRDKWPVVLDVLSPIAYLGELAYVDNLGANYEGRAALIDIISSALTRGFNNVSEAFDILTYCPLGYKQINQPLVDTGNFLSEVSLSQDIWVDENSGEATNCQTVLFDVLNSLGLSITQIESDTWLIYDSLVDLRNINTKYIKKFDKDGVQLADDFVNRFESNIIKSDGATTLLTELIHINEDQQFTYKRSVSSVAVDFNFISAPQFLENPNIEGGSSPRTLPNWIFIQATDGSYQSSVSASGFITLNGTLTSEPDKNGVTVESEKRYVEKGSFLSLVGDIDYQSADINEIFSHNFGVVLVTGTTTYYLTDGFGEQGRWIESVSTYAIKAEGRIELSVTLPEIPEDGELGVQLYPIQYTALNGTPTQVPAKLYYIDLIPSVGTEIGNTYTGKATTNNKGQVTKEEIKISTAISYSVLNALYRNEEPLEAVFHFYFSKTANLGEIAVNRFLIQGKKRIYFTGSVYNPLELHHYFQILEISNFYFRIQSYEFDANSNIGFVELLEVKNSLIGYDYEKLPIYGSTIEPTIVS